MKKFYLTYKDYQSLNSSFIKEMQNLVNSLLLSHKKGILTALEKEQKFILEGEFNEEDAKQLKEYGFKEIRLFEIGEVIIKCDSGIRKEIDLGTDRWATCDEFCSRKGGYCYGKTIKRIIVDK